MNNKAKIFTGICAFCAIIAIAIIFILSGNKTYEISFDTDGGSFISTQEVKKDGKVEKPSNPIKEGYTFVRWEYQNKEYNFTSPVKSDFTLKAIWQKNEEVTPIQKYKITFNVEKQTKTIEASNISEINPDNLGFEEKTGYVLKWYLNGTEFKFVEPLSSDLTLEGKYEKTLDYTVKFNSNGGNSIAKQVVKAAGKVTEPTNVKKEGYILDGWYLNNKKYDFNTEVNKNFTLVAKWIEDPNIKRYEVKFNSDGGSAISSQKIIENKTVTAPANPSKSGYNFEGWYLDNVKYDFNSKVTKDITLVAKWEKIITYTVSFNTNGGTKYANQVIEQGGKASNPGNPYKEGYVFIGWDFDFNTPITSDKTINANYRELNKYTVTFDYGMDNKKENQVVNEGTLVGLPNATRNHYKFLGWYLNDKQYSGTITAPVTTNMTLVAKWQQNVFKIKSTAVDQYSPDVTLTVLDGNNVVYDYKTINYTDGTKICSSSNPTVSKSDFESENSFIVIMGDGTRFNATK